jgi:hypothetical protein
VSRRTIAAILFAASLALIVVGIALIYPPAALITAGLLLGALLFVDIDRARA